MVTLVLEAERLLIRFRMLVIRGPLINLSHTDTSLATTLGNSLFTSLDRLAIQFPHFITLKLWNCFFLKMQGIL